MRARILPLLAAFCALLCALVPGVTAAQDRPTHIAARLVAEGPAAPGGPLTLAIAFDPEPGWHGYWKNPGDAGYGMELEWDLPPGWRAGEPQYPVPERLVIGGLMNHVYEGPYAVLVDVGMPGQAATQTTAPIAVDAQWLACTDKICVPERARLTLDVAAPAPPRAFDKWRSAIPALLDQPASFALRGERLWIAIPIPASMAVGEPHVFLGERDIVQYAGVQTFMADGDLLVAGLPLAQGAKVPDEVSGILSFGDGNGVRFRARAGPVPDGGTPLRQADDAGAIAPLWMLVLGALAGGLLLNVMPCVFPILSLKALSLARAGESDAKARAEGLAYSAGVILATVLLGVLLLALRSAGEMVGWAFQLQEPAVVVGLLVLATAITANLAGIYELPSLSVTRGGEPASAFVTGLLAAFVATPCTGPFMAAAMGAALLLPALQAILLFAVLGLGLALPFLLLGFVPSLRRMLPRPGPWMERFRRWMALPMGLTALALVWLCWRLGGSLFAVLALAIAAASIAILLFVGRRQRTGRPVAGGALLAFASLVVVAIFTLSRVDAAAPGATSVPEGESIAARPFSETRLAEARAAGKPVFVWFTADWCLTCKVNERVAIEREATRVAFEQAGVVALVGDWTRRDPQITRFLSRHGAAGVPLYLWYAPGRQAEVMPQVLTAGDLVRRAGGSSIARAAGREAERTAAR